MSRGFFLKGGWGGSLCGGDHLLSCALWLPLLFAHIFVGVMEGARDGARVSSLLFSLPHRGRSAPLFPWELAEKRRRLCLPLTRAWQCWRGPCCRRTPVQRGVGDAGSSRGGSRQSRFEGLLLGVFSLTQGGSQRHRTTHNAACCLSGVVLFCSFFPKPQTSLGFECGEKERGGGNTPSPSKPKLIGGILGTAGRSHAHWPKTLAQCIFRS